MKKALKHALLASTIVGVSGFHAAAQASTKDGFYLTPNAEVIFVDKKFTKGVSNVGVGGGGGLGLGYQIKNWLIDLNADYQYYGGKGTINQTTSSYGTAWLALAGVYNKAYQTSLASGKTALEAQQAGAGAVIADIGNAATSTILSAAGGAALGATPGTKVATTVDSKESFVPLTIGVKYLIPLTAGGKFSLTPGIAGGVWFHNVKRDISTVIGTGATASPAVTSTDNASETKGVVVPSLSFDYAPTDRVTISFSGKFYIVPGGYSDNYTASQQAAASASAVDDKTLGSITAANAATTYLPKLASGVPLGITPDYSATKQSFWYGGLNLGVQYTF